MPIRATAAGLWLWALLPLLQGQSRLSVLTAFDQPPDMSAVESMERETAALFSNAGLSFWWQPKQQANDLGMTDLLVSVQFRGKCRLEPSVLVPATDGPLGSIQFQDGEIRPFIEVDCDRAAAMVWQNRGTVPAPLAAYILGRALGRVVAHELYHYLTQSNAHTASELFSRRMRSDDLTVPGVRFEAGEIEALRRGLSEREGGGLR